MDDAAEIKKMAVAAFVGGLAPGLDQQNRAALASWEAENLAEIERRSLAQSV